MNGLFKIINSHYFDIYIYKIQHDDDKELHLKLEEKLDTNNVSIKNESSSKDILIEYTATNYGTYSSNCQKYIKTKFGYLGHFKDVNKQKKYVIINPVGYVSCSKKRLRCFKTIYIKLFLSEYMPLKNKIEFRKTKG